MIGDDPHPLDTRRRHVPGASIRAAFQMRMAYEQDILDDLLARAREEPHGAYRREILAYARYAFETIDRMYRDDDTCRTCEGRGQVTIVEVVGLLDIARRNPTHPRDDREPHKTTKTCGTCEGTGFRPCDPT